MASTLSDIHYHDRRTHERRRLVGYPSMLKSFDGMRVSWGGVWGGVLVAVGLLLLLAALGVAVGISAVNPDQTSSSSLGTGAGIWAAVSLLISLFVGGLVSTRIGATFDRTTGFFEGALVWVVSVILLGSLAGSGVGLAGGASGLFSGASDMAANSLEQGRMAAWIAFGALVLSLLACILGAFAGRRSPQSQA